MNENQTDQAPVDEVEERRRAAQVDAIMRAVSELLPRFGPQGVPPEVIAEGAVKGAAVILMRGLGCTLFDVADVMDGFAEGFRNLPQVSRESFRVVE